MSIKQSQFLAVLTAEFMHEYYKFKMKFCYFLLQYLVSKFSRLNKNLCSKARRAVFKFNFSFWCWAWRPCSGSVSVKFYHAMLWEYEYDIEVWALDFKDWLCHCFIFCFLRINFLLSLIMLKALLCLAMSDVLVFICVISKVML